MQSGIMPVPSQAAPIPAERKSCVLKQYRTAAAPKVAELAGLTECGRIPDHMIVNVGFVDVGADDISVIASGRTPGQLAAQTIRFFRCDLAGDKGLPQMVGNHIIPAAHSAGLLDIM